MQLREKMPKLVKAIDAAGQSVTWICDPMHGNTESCEGFKTRRYENIRREVRCLLQRRQLLKARHSAAGGTAGNATWLPTAPHTRYVRASAS